MIDAKKPSSFLVRIKTALYNGYEYLLNKLIQKGSACILMSFLAEEIFLINKCTTEPILRPNCVRTWGNVLRVPVPTGRLIHSSSYRNLNTKSICCMGWYTMQNPCPILGFLCTECNTLKSKTCQQKAIQFEGILC